jgi:DNA-binding transcriptional LysR family regulator
MRVTQPSVSEQIDRLEQELGFPLFDRSDGRLKPTAEGMLFYAEEVLTGMDRLSEAARQIRTAQAGRLIIASHPGAAISIPPVLISAFVAERSGVHVRVLSRNSDVIGRLLPSESYDVGIAELPVDNAVVLTRFRVRCVAILSSTHPLACCPTLSPQRYRASPPLRSRARSRPPPGLHLPSPKPERNGRPQSKLSTSPAYAVALPAGRGGRGRSPVGKDLSALGPPARSSLPSTTRLAPFVRDREPSILAQSFLSMLVDKLGPLYA